LYLENLKEIVHKGKKLNIYFTIITARFNPLEERSHWKNPLFKLLQIIQNEQDSHIYVWYNPYKRDYANLKAILIDDLMPNIDACINLGFNNSFQFDKNFVENVYKFYEI
jgi:hypothetical protein